MHTLHRILFLSLAVILIVSCKKDQKIAVDPPPPYILPSVVFNFKAITDNAPVIKNTKWYMNANGDSFTVSKFNYYISNIKLKREDGTYFSETYSYHVIKNVDGVNSFTIANVPEGNYDQVEFLIGVDSAKNVSGAQTGDLSPDSMMYWGWSSGYIFFKLEGKYKTTTMQTPAGFAMHVGGATGINNALKKCTFSLTNQIVAARNKQSKVFYNANINEIFVNPQVIDFANYYVIASSRQARYLADNYSDMFTIEHIEN